MKYFYKIIGPVIILAGLYFIFRTKEIKQPPGILVSSIPTQESLSQKKVWEKNDFIYTAVAKYKINLKVLSIRYYGSDEMSEFSPLDIAAGWRQMSDQSIVDRINIKQQHRWYVWSTKFFPIPRKDIEESSSNIHIIPANENIEEIFDEVIRGNIISMEGYLVNIKSKESKRNWKTSTRRDDTGSGACEILWTNKIKILQ